LSSPKEQPQLFVRLKQVDGRLLCLLPVGVAIEDRGHGAALITQFHSGVIVGRWTVKGDSEEITRQFERQAVEMKTVLMLEAASPDSVAAMLQRMIGDRLRSHGAELNKAIAAGVQKELRKMAGQEPSAGKQRAKGK